MRLVVQRVRSARVVVDGQVVGEIGLGLLAFVGVEAGDPPSVARATARKLAELRVFENAEGKLGLSLREVQGAVLLVSQFTLLADVSRGRRPSFERAEKRERAEELLAFLEGELRALEIPVATGRFGAQMDVELVNFGPVTLVFDVPARSAPVPKRSEVGDKASPLQRRE